MGPGQRAEEMQVGGVEEAYGAISATTEDIVLAHRDAVGHSGLQAEKSGQQGAPAQAFLHSHLPRGAASQGEGGEHSPAAPA